MRPWDARFLVSKYLRCMFLHVFAHCMHDFLRLLVSETLRCTFLHVFAHCMYLRYTNTCYKVLTFSCTYSKILNTVLHSTDLMMHDFKLHEFFHSPKNVLLKALLYEESFDSKRTHCAAQWIVRPSMCNGVELCFNEKSFSRAHLFLLSSFS